MCFGLLIGQNKAFKEFSHYLIKLETQIYLLIKKESSEKAVIKVKHLRN